MKNLFVVLFAAVLLTSCSSLEKTFDEATAPFEKLAESSDSPGEPAPPRVTAGELLDTWSAHLCDTATRCCELQVIDDCEEALRNNDAFRCIERGVTAGRITIVQSYADRCIRAMKENANFCGNAPESFLFKTEACALSLRGKGRSGDACDRTCGTNAFGSECDFGFFCTSTGRCERLPTVDDPSCGTDFTCPLNFHCDRSSNVCVERRGPGASCTGDEQCDFEHTCSNGRCLAICR